MSIDAVDNSGEYMHLGNTTTDQISFGTIGYTIMTCVVAMGIVLLIVITIKNSIDPKKTCLKKKFCSYFISFFNKIVIFIKIYICLMYNVGYGFLTYFHAAIHNFCGCLCCYNNVCSLELRRKGKFYRVMFKAVAVLGVVFLVALVVTAFFQ